MDDDFAFRERLRQRRRQKALRKKEEETKRKLDETRKRKVEERREKERRAQEKAAQRGARMDMVKVDHENSKQKRAKLLRMKERRERQVRSKASISPHTEETRMLRALLYVPVVPPRLDRNMRLAILHRNSKCLSILQDPALFGEDAKRAWRLRHVRPFVLRWRVQKSIRKAKAAHPTFLVPGGLMRVLRRYATRRLTTSDCFVRWRQAIHGDLYWRRYLKQRGLFSAGQTMEAIEKVVAPKNFSDDQVPFLPTVIEKKRKRRRKKKSKNKKYEKQQGTSVMIETKTGAARDWKRGRTNGADDADADLVYNSSLRVQSWPESAEMVNSVPHLNAAARKMKISGTVGFNPAVDECLSKENAMVWCDVGKHYVSSTFHFGDVNGATYCVLCEREYNLLDLPQKRRDVLEKRGRDSFIPEAAIRAGKVRLEVVFDMRVAEKAHKAKQARLALFQQARLGERAKAVFEQQVEACLIEHEREVAEIGPEALAWTEHYSGEHGKFYYHNSKTGISSWEQPVEYRMQADEKTTRAVLRLQNAFRARLVDKSELLTADGSKWVLMKDSSGVSFLYNSVTKEFRW